MFFVDAEVVPAFRKLLDPKAGAWPNYSYFEQLRKELGSNFGYAVVDSDGDYILDLAGFERCNPNQKLQRKRRTTEDRYRKVVRQMKTFICERCMEEELREHPQLGSGDWTEEWFTAMAALAQEQGWVMADPTKQRESWFYEEFEVVGPKCAASIKTSEKKPAK
ncbi:MAG TPA: hypothetical protein VFV87_09080 [Pirellulaceae bacterium]|nr:hypothetical protein [Pirellulaceae bacterium]